MYIVLFVSVLCLSAGTLATYTINVNNFLTGLTSVTPRDADLFDIEEFLNSYGYPFENHEVTTEDGYILALHRITSGRNENVVTKDSKPAVLIMHGLCSSSVDFFILGPENSIALMLADQGYDVWLGNNRGTTWSRKHSSLDPDTDATFWDFSFHEFGVYDDAAMIDYILETTRNDHLSYIGHSQGTTQFFALAAMKPEYNEKVNVMAALGPTAYQQNLTNPLIQFLKNYYTPLTLLADYLNITEVAPHSTILTAVLQTLCEESSPLHEVCVGVMFFVVGFDPEQLNRTAIPLIFEHLPAGTSLKVLKHFLQQVKSGNFRQFDYGILKNFETYNQAYPPDYDVSLITTPIALYYGQNDLLVGMPDVERLAGELPNLAELHLIEYEKFNHADFLFGNDVESMVYYYVINLLNQYNGFNLISSTTAASTLSPNTTPTRSTTQATTTVTESNSTDTDLTGASDITTVSTEATTSATIPVYNFLQIISIYIALIPIKLVI